VTGAVALAQVLFPDWRVGWFESSEGRCGVDVTRKNGCRIVVGDRACGPEYERKFWCGRTWEEVLAQLEGRA
jgi:hypothetical protein